ncbi:hypothetical protein QFZ72_003355 [Bacillus sp. V2I10]|nr:hypothetical protein [Bacillus sp. V2I10]
MREVYSNILLFLNPFNPEYRQSELRLRKTCSIYPSVFFWVINQDMSDKSVDLCVVYQFLIQLTPPLKIRMTGVIQTIHYAYYVMEH